MLNLKQLNRSIPCALTLYLLLSWGIFPAHAQSFEDLTYMTEEYYPFNYTEKGEVKGISVELLHLVWKELGVTPQPIEVLPWARAYDRIQHEPRTFLFSMARTEDREDMFQWAGPTMVARFVLIAKKSSNITLTSLKDLAGKSVGTLRKDISDILLKDYNGIAKVEAVAKMEQNVSKLVSDRLDMVAYEKRSWERLIKRLGLYPDDFETVFTLCETSVYYAFHQGIPPAMVREFQQALDLVKARPAYQQVLDVYLK